MDLSAVIFVVLAVAWALYLIPKALKHHDEMASDRLVEGHSERVRILSRHGRKATATVAEESVEVSVEEAEEVVVEQAPVTPAAPAAAPAPAAARPLPTRAAARRAARNRRRVLGVLLLVTAVVGVLSYLAYAPAWSAAIPGGMIVAFLVLARITVRKQQQSRRVVAPSRAAAVEEQVEEVAPAEVEVMTTALTEQGTSAAERQEIEAALADDGSLWDPLPMTLPTYVNKARARRTVRTIELTGMTSSGHDSTDTALAREAEEKAKELASQEQVAPRKAAGA